MLELIPMTEAEFTAYLAGAIKNYADEKVKAGNWPAEGALGSSKRDYLNLLPEGVASKDQHLFSLKDTDMGKTVGMIWFAVQEQAGQPTAFIYDFSVDEAFRGRGYGKAALVGLEQKVSVLGVTSISLHVFGHNRAAWALYEKLGYKVTNVNMTKRLENSTSNGEP